MGRCRTGGVVLSNDRSSEARDGEVGGVGITVDDDWAESESDPESLSASVAWEGDDCSSDSSS
jgi:hypothetical protein